MQVLRRAASLLILLVLGGGCSPPPTTGGVPPPPCASSEPTPVTSPALTLNGLVPFDPVNLRLCHYGGLNAQPRLGLLGTFLDTNAAEVQGYEHQFNQLPPFPTGASHCPNDDGSALVAIFSAANQAIRVQASLTGCRPVTNGIHVYESGPTIDQLVSKTKP
jgi:hypothetical protein